MDSLNSDPESMTKGTDQLSREVFSGHYVPVIPLPLKDPEYVYHSRNLFRELGLSDDLAFSADFISMFSGDLSDVPPPCRNIGWACGYALSIYGREFYELLRFDDHFKLRREHMLEN